MLAAYSMIRLTSDSGRKLNRKTPRPATLESVENAITDMPRGRASCAVAGTDSANSGPRMISAPCSSACCVPWPAPCGLPPSSLINNWMLGFWNSASAISAAFFIDCAATPALPAAESGRINPTLTCPLPTASGCCVGPDAPASGCEPNGLENCPKLRATSPEQAPSRGAPSSKPTAVRRVAPEGFCPECGDLGLRGPTIVSLLLTDRDRPERPLGYRSGGWIQTYCRRIVNQNKRFIAPRARAGLQTPVPLTVMRPRISLGRKPRGASALFPLEVPRTFPRREGGIHFAPKRSRLPLCAQKLFRQIRLKARRVFRPAHFPSAATS